MKNEPKHPALRLESLEGRECPSQWTTSWSWWSSGPVIHTTNQPMVSFSSFPASNPVVSAPIPVKAPVASVATTNASPGNSVLAYAESRVGQVVTWPNAYGCTALVAAALASAGAVPQSRLGTSGPVANHYVWGSLVYQRSAVAGYSPAGTVASIKPGDIIQFDNYAESHANGSWLSAQHHTAIVESVNATTGQVTVLQQNWNGNSSVTRGVFDFNTMTTGVVSVYRPIAA